LGALRISEGRFCRKCGLREFVGHGENQAGGDGGKAGSGACGIEDLPNIGNGGFGRGETEFGEVEADSEDMVRPETEIAVEELREAAESESRANKEHRGESNLANDEELTKEIGAGGGAETGGVLLERCCAWRSEQARAQR
jgi:general stress protein YciG